MIEFVLRTDFSPRLFEVFCFLDLEDRNDAWRLLPRHVPLGKMVQRLCALMDNVDGLANSTTINKILEDVPDDVLMRGARNPVHIAKLTGNSHVDCFPFCSVLNDS